VLRFCGLCAFLQWQRASSSQPANGELGRVITCRTNPSDPPLERLRVDGALLIALGTPEPPVSEAAASSFFDVGAKVMLVGLEGRPHLNGSIGVVLGNFCSSCRHSVELEGLKISVKPRNMQALQSSPVGASSCLADACLDGPSPAPGDDVKQPLADVGQYFGPPLEVPAPTDDAESLAICASDLALPGNAAAAPSCTASPSALIPTPASVGALDVETWSVSSLRAAFKDCGL
jgi:hypothetical protein